MIFLVTGTVAILSGMIKASMGMGAGMLFTPLLTLIIGPPAAVATMSFLLVTANVFAISNYWRDIQWRYYLTLAPSAIVGAFLGGFLVVKLPPGPASRVIGLITVIIGGYRLWREWKHGEPLRLRPSLPVGILVGFFGGLFTGMSAGGGVILGLYLLALGLPKRFFVATSPSLVFLLDITKTSVIWKLGGMPKMVLFPVLAAMPLVFVGGWLGKRLNDRLSEGHFHKALSVGVVVIGSVLLVR